LYGTPLKRIRVIGTASDVRRAILNALYNPFA
jgi:hypothetical protein